MLAVIIALVLSSFLDARALHKSAVNQPAGTGRDLAMAATGALQGVSNFTQITQIRQGIANVVGLGDKDTINTKVIIPIKAPAPPIVPTKLAKPTKPVVPVKEVFSPQKKMKLYFGGDSLMGTVGLAMEQIGPRTGVMTVEPADFHISTGLNRPDAFNWFSHLTEMLKAEDPDVVSLMFGGNDADAYMSGLPENAKQSEHFGDAVWEQEYRRRVGGMMDLATQKPGRFVIWMGEPQMEESALNEKIIKLNEVYKTEAAKRPGRVIYLDLYSLFSPNGAKYSDTITVGGVKKVVRAPDGVHITMEGGAVVSGEVLKLLARQYDLRNFTPASLSLTG